jgi:glucose/arabinose dehydrogenase
MLAERARLLLLCTLLSLCQLLGACNGGGGNPGLTGAPDPASGTLAVVFNGLPSGASGSARITGPANFTLDLTQSLTLPRVAPGLYNIDAAAVTLDGATWAPYPPSQGVTIAAGGSAAAVIGYAAASLPVGLTEMASGLDEPVFLAAPNDDPRQFIVERGGRVRVMENSVVLARPFLDIARRVSATGEGGLLSLAFDPLYASNGYFYVLYTDLQHNIVLERWRTSSNPYLADTASSLVILRIAHPVYTNHYGGLVAFGPDGYLYLGTGDGGGTGDPQGNAQNPGSLLGKLLRIDVRGASAVKPYAIPPSNPYSGQSGRRPEIWASGLRNPWRFAFDGPRLYLADEGQDRREEVNIALVTEAGLNYGWNLMEGSLCFSQAACVRPGLTLPAFEYDDGDANGCAIIGGYVYRGQALPELDGHYFYSDYCGGYLRSIRATDDGVLEQRSWNVNGLIGPVVSFGQDGQGGLYVISARGRIYKIERTFTRKG